MGLKYDLPLDHPDNRNPRRRDRRMGFYHETGGMLRYEDSNDEQQLQSFLSRARLDPKILSNASNVEFLALQVGKKMFKLMLKPEDEVTTSLRIVDSGMDSLIAIEFRRWWRITLGVDVGVVEILGAGTVEDLGKLAAEGFAQKIAESA